eukprot:210192_1
MALFLALIYWSLVNCFAARNDYYFAHINLNFSNAELFCQNSCDSNLASMHSVKDWNNLVEKCYGIDHVVWIGLHDIQLEGKYEFSDNTIFDYGTNISGGVLPWATGEPSNTHESVDCIVLKDWEDFRWTDWTCYSEKPLACNSCKYNSYTETTTPYVSISKLNYFNAEKYCNVQCGSNLVSFSNEKQFAMGKQIMKQTSMMNNQRTETSLWIGLDNLTGHFSWIDGTSFTDYGADFQQYPWKEKFLTKYNNGKCAVMNWGFVTQGTSAPMPGHNWKTEPCDTDYLRFICNSCDGVLNKYIMVDKQMNYTDSNTYCADTFNTSLASVHSSVDYNNIQLLCNLSRNQQSCWIGMKLIDTIYEWDDESFLYYADYHIFNNLWVQSPIQNCVFMDVNNEFKLNSGNCSDDTNFFICNKPSILCSDHESNWNVLYGNMWLFNKCIVSTQSMNGTDAIIYKDIQWINNNGRHIIEAQILFEKVKYNFSLAGVTIYPFSNTMSDYYYFVISPVSHNESMVYLLKYWNNKYITLDEELLLIEFELNVYYTLTIEIIDFTTVNVTVNGETHLLTSLNSNEIFDSILSGYIGLRAENTSIKIKSLFISGTPWNLSPVVKYTTNSPETTEKPSDISTTESVDFGVTVTISFQYNTINLTNITSILKNITNNLINEGLLTATIECTNGVTIDIDITPTNNNNSDTATVIATVVLCDEEDSNILLAVFENELEKDFVNKINDDGHILLIANSTNIKIKGIVIKNGQVVISTTSLILSTRNKETKKTETIFEQIWFSVMIIALLTILCCIIIGFLYYYKHKKRQSQKRIDMIP